MCAHDPDGAGPLPELLYAGGGFTSIGGVAASRAAVWNGANWSALAAGVNGAIFALAMFDADANGPQPAQLYAGLVHQQPRDAGRSRDTLGCWTDTNRDTLANNFELDSLAACNLAHPAPRHSCDWPASMRTSSGPTQGSAAV